MRNLTIVGKEVKDTRQEKKIVKNKRKVVDVGIKWKTNISLKMLRVAHM